MANEEKAAAAKAKQPGKLSRMWKGLREWFRGMRSELKKVVWPTGKQIFNNTLVALVVMVVAAIVIWGFDEVASMAVNLLISVAR